MASRMSQKGSIITQGKNSITIHQCAGRHLSSRVVGGNTVTNQSTVKGPHNSGDAVTQHKQSIPGKQARPYLRRCCWQHLGSHYRLQVRQARKPLEARVQVKPKSDIFLRRSIVSTGFLSGNIHQWLAQCNQDGGYIATKLPTLTTLPLPDNPELEHSCGSATHSCTTSKRLPVTH